MGKEAPGDEPGYRWVSVVGGARLAGGERWAGGQLREEIPPAAKTGRHGAVGPGGPGARGAWLVGVAWCARRSRRSWAMC